MLLSPSSAQTHKPQKYSFFILFSFFSFFRFIQPGTMLCDLKVRGLSFLAPISDQVMIFAGLSRASERFVLAMELAVDSGIFCAVSTVTHSSVNAIIYRWLHRCGLLDGQTANLPSPIASPGHSFGRC